MDFLQIISYIQLTTKILYKWYECENMMKSFTQFLINYAYDAINFDKAKKKFYLCFIVRKFILLNIKVENFSAKLP